jgi:hypothetical protein
VLLFDTGKLVITGSRTIADVNTALYLLTALFSDEQFQSKQPLLPSYKRYEARLESLQSSIKFEGYATRGRKAVNPVKREAPVVSPFTHLKRRKIDALPDDCDTTEKLFLEACRRNHLDYVRLFVQCIPGLVPLALGDENTSDQIKAAIQLLIK